MSNLQTSLATGTSIGGFSIETSSLTAVSADPTPVTPTDPTDPVTPTDPQNVYISDDSEAKRYRDIAIIVGVVIPVGLSKLFI